MTHSWRRVMTGSALAAVFLAVLVLCAMRLVLGGLHANGSDAGLDVSSDSGSGTGSGGADDVGESGYAACISRQVSPEAWIREPTGLVPEQGWTATVVLEQGKMIKPGARVTTGPHGQVLLVFADGSTATIGPSSDLVIGPRNLQSATTSGSIIESDGGALLRLVPPQIRLTIGNIWLEVDRRIDSGPSFEVETPSSTVSVRGTVFSVEVDEEETTYVYVESGRVVVESELGSLIVDPGQSAVAQKGKRPEAAPEPRPGGKPGNGPKDREYPVKKTELGIENEENDRKGDEDLDKDLDRDDQDEQEGGTGNGRRPADQTLSH